MLNSAQDLNFTRSPSLQYSPIITELSIEQSKAILIFTQATAQAVRLIDAPVAILTAIGGSGCQIGSISGLEKFRSLPTNPNLRLELAGWEYCHDRVIAGDNRLSIPNCQQHPQLAQSPLCQVHGVRSYLGLPIITAASDRLGTIAILDFKPRKFSERDSDLLQLISRLVASEFERQLLSQAQLNRWIGDLRYQATPGFDDPVAAVEHGGAGLKLPAHQSTILADAISSSIPDRIQGEIQFKLMTHLAQELRTPLTSVLGMASVLQQEIYGPLSTKQKDYLGIIHHSGQQLVTIVDEISQLGGFNLPQHQLTIKSVDLEMLCQLAIQSLEPLAQKKQQQIILDLTGGDTAPEIDRDRSWRLDKDKVRQIIYYLCLSLIDASAIDRQISIQIYHLTDSLQIQILTNDPHAILSSRYLTDEIEQPHPIVQSSPPPDTSHPQEQQLHISLGLSLSHILAGLHQGKIETIANNQGYRLTLPLIPS
jgi:signal transduction histidine kinase